MGRSKGILLALVFGLLLLSGCGGRGSGEEIVTTRSEATLDPDALLLAAQHVTGYVVPVQTVRDREGELRSARQAFPEIGDVHAAPPFNPHELHFAISNAAPWRESWKAGKLATGIGELDTLFQDFDAKTVRFLNEDGDQSWFAVTFDTYLRANRAAGLFFGKSDALRVTSTVSNPTSENNIFYEFMAPNVTRLIFVQGETTTTLEKTGSGSWVKQTSASL
jgi:hypothetical protein